MSSSRLSKWFFRVRRRLRALVIRFPGIYIPLMRWRYRSSEGAGAVRRKTDIVIEGFERSGNSFAVAAFRLAQNRPVRIAHHLHVAGQVVVAHRLGVPALVLIRKPEDAIVSLLFRYPHLSVAQALRSYRRFYEPLVPLRRGLVLARFESVISDFGMVTKRVNEVFRTSFEVFEHSPENAARCFALIEQANRTKYGKGEVDEISVARPSGARAEAKARLVSEYRSPRWSDERRRVEAIYAALVERADV
ncbi:MAG: hypothetical protein ACRDHO_02985 [Actinomycetota bacterium]